KNPALIDDFEWFRNTTMAFRRMQWLSGVRHRFEFQKQNPDHQPAFDLHVIRLGDIAFATNPFEYSIDFGIQIKIRSPAKQTFLVQLANAGHTYTASPRSVAGGGYGAVPASCKIGPEGGQIWAEK